MKYQVSSRAKTWYLYASEHVIFTWLWKDHCCYGYIKNRAFHCKNDALTRKISSNIEQQRQRRSRNVLHMSIAIISVFVFCWLPFITNVLIDNYRSSFMYFSCSFWLYFHVTSYVAAANCAFNPIICFTFSRNYRLGLKRLINSSSGVQQQV